MTPKNKLEKLKGKILLIEFPTKHVEELIIIDASDHLKSIQIEVEAVDKKRYKKEGNIFIRQSSIDKLIESLDDSVAISISGDFNQFGYYEIDKIKIIEVYKNSSESKTKKVLNIKEKFVKVPKANFRIEMIGYDETIITAFTTTEIQKRHVIEMFKNIKEKGKIKYKISSKSI